MTWEVFVERLMECFHEVHQTGKRADILVMLNRKDKATGQRLPLAPTDVQIKFLEL